MFTSFFFLLLLLLIFIHVFIRWSTTLITLLKITPNFGGKFALIFTLQLGITSVVKTSNLSYISIQFCVRDDHFCDIRTTCSLVCLFVSSFVQLGHVCIKFAAIEWFNNHVNGSLLNRFLQIGLRQGLRQGSDAVEFISTTSCLWSIASLKACSSDTDILQLFCN